MAVKELHRNNGMVVWLGWLVCGELRSLAVHAYRASPSTTMSTSLDTSARSWPMCASATKDLVDAGEGAGGKCHWVRWPLGHG